MKPSLQLAFLVLLTAAACAPRGGAACTGARSIPLDGPLAVRAVLGMPHEPWPLDLHDVDGDGALDLVVGGDALALFVGDGRGGFQELASSPFRQPLAAEDFAYGDFDEDGVADIVVAEHEQPRFFLFRGTGDGDFVHAEASPFVVDAVPHLHAIAASDFDEDGHLDVVVDSWPESRLVFVRGRGNGTFDAPGRPFAVPEAPLLNLRAGDIDGDGHVDVVTPAHDVESVTVMLGDGRGGFRDAPGSPFASAGGFSRVALADLDGDGDLDVAVVHRSDPTTQYKQDALSILLNDGGRLAHGPGSPFTDLSGRAESLAIGDTNGDGHPDVVTVSGRGSVVSVFHGGEAGFTFGGASHIEGPGRAVAAGDVDGDGRAEVFVSDSKARRVLVLAED